MEKETFAESLRNHIYYLFVNLMTYANTNSLVFSVFLLAESLQLFSYPFNYHFYDESNSDTARYFSESTTYLRVPPCNDLADSCCQW
ncbi:MAG: hypothetical protein P4M11_14760 [Candidatus Pacebacteria bacterium]|nr:hypothetical protein [Candidatus Paceibacterota bacterium]